MSTQTAPATTRQLANRLETVLDWIRDNPFLPAGFMVTVSPRDNYTKLAWHPYSSSPTEYASQERLADALTHHFGPPTRHNIQDRYSNAQWAAEGDRPELIVFCLPALTEQVAS